MDVQSKVMDWKWLELCLASRGADPLWGGHAQASRGVMSGLC